MTAPIVPAVPAVPPVVPAEVPPVAPQVEAKPPWGTPEEFDPEKAWDLITKLRAQKNDPAVAKELSELRAKTQAFEDEKRTDVEKAQARAETAEKALAVREAEALRASIALEKGLTASQAKRLVGATREELEADAADLLADLKATTPVVPKAPGTDGQGNVGEPIGAGAKAQLSKEDVSKLYTEKNYAAIEAARKDGQLAGLLGPTP